jgi:A/G-specific adenine glycosylase
MFEEQKLNDFVELLWDFYAHSKRADLLWRQPDKNGQFNPYKIMVSELMLQQTQVARVTQKYQEFLELFPTANALAAADLGDVLRAWQGLGYNRRAKFLWQAAQAIQVVGEFPITLPELVKLPGIGPNTAGAILAYAYNEPVLFVETNVRSVYIHHFFADQEAVSDKQILEVLESTLDHENPREFYWALMDYGSHLKTTVGNAARASKHYAKQSAFNGSRRQVRGQVLRVLGIAAAPLKELQVAIPDDRLLGVLVDLQVEGLIHLQANGTYSL